VRQASQSEKHPPKATLLDMNALGGASEINLKGGEGRDGVKRQLQLGVCILVPALGKLASPKFRVLEF
jgi:hypothetical protein